MRRISSTPSRLRARTSRSVLLLSCLTIAAVLPGAASAAPEPDRGLLVVEGQGGTTAILEVEEEIVLRDPRTTLSGGRSHAAVLVESVDQRPGERVRFGAVRVSAFRDGTDQALGVLGFTDRLRPGSYLVTLLGDGRVRASYQLANPEGPGVRVVPRTPIRPRFFHRAEALPAGNAASAVDLPRTLPRGRRAIQVLLLAAPHIDEIGMCATTSQACGSRVVVPATTDGSPQILVDLVQPHPFPRDLRWRVSGYRTQDDRLRAAAIVF